MIELLLPPPVEVAEAFGDLPDEPPFPGEADLVERAVAGRRREFVTARRCARQALGRLGHPPAPLRTGPQREPCWPTGVVGSITHCAGYRAAAVAHTADLASIGIDAEPHEPLPDGVRRLVTTAGDAEVLDRLARLDPTIHWDRLLFSAKEAIYKAWFPLTRRWLDFAEATLAIDPDTATFTGHLHTSGVRQDGGPPLVDVVGRYLMARGLVLTAVTVAA